MFALWGGSLPTPNTDNSVKKETDHLHWGKQKDVQETEHNLNTLYGSTIFI